MMQTKYSLNYDFLNKHGIEDVSFQDLSIECKDTVKKIIKIDNQFGTVYAKVIDGVIYIFQNLKTVLSDIDIAVPYLIEKQRKYKKKKPVEVRVLKANDCVPTLTVVV